MKPMFLPGVEKNPEPGPYYERLQTLGASGAEYPQIWHLFAFRPPGYQASGRVHASGYARAGADRAGASELIAAYRSRLNGCRF